ncbi:anaphase-promoting complex subunit 1-like [Tubulanus polymorphus]|uniref:anaphase-promoting complex subunit 1-like n=1 Tax=Tubulanus polymorphus TaxID=672921 RepID=UPI003DA2994D
MLTTRDSQQFVPFGRIYYKHHPGEVELQIRNTCQSSNTDGLPLVQALRDISLYECKSTKEIWQLRGSSNEKGELCDEELYIQGRTVIWSRGSQESNRVVLKSFTLDSNVQDALWVNFMLPPSHPFDSLEPNPMLEGDLQKGVCILEQNSLHVFTNDGHDYTAALPFQVQSIWSIEHGILLERIPGKTDKDRSDANSSIPIMFSLMHPLDEIAPVVTRGAGTIGGGGSGNKVQFFSDANNQIVYTNVEPSLAVTYDSVLGLHTVWRVRKAKPEEVFFMSVNVLEGTNASTVATATPGPSRSINSSTSHSKLTISSQSPGLSPFRSQTSRLNSPVSRLSLSPGISHLGLSRSQQSPSLSMSTSGMLRYQTPPHLMNTPGAAAARTPSAATRTPVSHNVSIMNDSSTEVGEPLTPDICLEQIWMEPTSRNSGSRAKKCFISTDLCGQTFLCMLTNRQDLKCVKFEASNDQSQLIFGSIYNIQAKDAIPLESLSMLLVLDSDSSLILYSGIKKVNKIHLMGAPCPSLSTSMTAGRPSLSALQSPFSKGVMTSSRPASALDVRIDDELPINMLSPVPTEINESSQSLLNSSSLTEEFPFLNTLSTIHCLRDPVDKRFTLEMGNGTLLRTSLPSLSTSPIVSLCLEAIKQVLPRDLAMQSILKWYTTLNAPGSANSQSEWSRFIKCLLSLMGFDAEQFIITHSDQDLSLSPVTVAKKPRPSDQGSNEDWEYLANSPYHQSFMVSQDFLLGLDPLQEIPSWNRPPSGGRIDVTAPLFQHIPALFYALHVVYEELKMNTLFHDDLKSVCLALCQLANELCLPNYVDLYCREFAQLSPIVEIARQIHDDQLKLLNYPSFLSSEPPNIHQWLLSHIQRLRVDPFPFFQNVNVTIKNIIAAYVVYFAEEDTTDINWECYLRRISAAGRRQAAVDIVVARKVMATASPHERVVLFLCEMNLTLKDLEYLPIGVVLPLREAIFQSRVSPPSDWPEQAYVLVGRQDLSKQISSKQKNSRSISTASRDTSWQFKSTKEEDDGMDCLDKRLLRLRFSEDLRVQEARRLLQSSKPVRIELVQRPEVSDHDFKEEQENSLYSYCIRTMALPIGRGMFTLSTYHPVATETLPIPKLCLTGRAPPRNNTIDLTHIDTPANMTNWPSFHNGVAAGLRIANSSQIDSTWIMYNRPKSNEMTNEHAGFLMALGLNGHLSTLDTLNVHDYLCRGHEMTGVGLLLGIAAAKRGSMDVATTRLLSIHLVALLPPTSTELDIHHIVQVAAVLGVGLVYQGTAHRHMAEVLLAEIGRPPGPEMENCMDRESYSLAAGLALGLVMLSRGSEATGLSDLNMADQLYNYMVGGHKRPLSGPNKERFKSPSYQINEGDMVNVDVTAPGATLALGMMFFRTNNRAVAEWLKACDTQFMLDFVRPDFLMLRMIAKGLVMWDSILPSAEWVLSHLPEIVSKYAFNCAKYRDDPDCDIDFETMSQAFLNIIAGCCMAMGLRFAGSANRSAYNCLLMFTKKFINFLSKPAMYEQAGKSVIENCMQVVLLSLAMVMAGTGDLEVLRICRYLRSRVGTSHTAVLYGSYVAVSMAIGLLFLGGGRFSLSTKPEAVAAMLCAFFPKFPTHSNDNRYHLQAFRHLYVLAAEPRVIIPKDVDSGSFCYIPLDVKYKDTEYFEDKWFTCVGPCLLPEIDQLEEVKITGDRYLPIAFRKDENWSNLKSILQHNGILHVKQRAGHLSYVEDPKGYRSLLAKFLCTDRTARRNAKPDFIKSFSSDPRVLVFAEAVCNLDNKQEHDMMQLMSLVLHECVTQEKPEVLCTHIAMDQIVRSVVNRLKLVDLWQLKLIADYYRRVQLSDDGIVLIHAEFLSNINNRIEAVLDQWFEDNMFAVSKYLRGEVVCTDVLLAGFLVWYNIPQADKLAKSTSSGKPSFPELCRCLQPSGLQIKDVMKLYQLIKLTKVS